MKTRSGFVSNSSSSSFIIAGPVDQLRDGVLAIPVKLSTIVDKVFTDEESLAKYFVREYGKNWREDDGEWLAQRYDDAVAELRAGNAVAIGNFSNEDDNPVSHLFYDSPQMFGDSVTKGGLKVVLGSW